MSAKSLELFASSASFINNINKGKYIYHHTNPAYDYYVNNKECGIFSLSKFKLLNTSLLFVPISSKVFSSLPRVTVWFPNNPSTYLPSLR